MRLTKLLSILALLLLLAACTQKATTPASPATATFDGLTLTVRLADDTFTDPLEVEVTVKNNGDKPAKWQGSSSCPDPTWVIAVTTTNQAEGQLHPVWPDGSSEPRACTADVVPHELKPGEELKSRWRWDGKVVQNPGTPQYREVKVDWQSITIVASFPVTEDQRRIEAVMLVNRPSK